VAVPEQVVLVVHHQQGNQLIKARQVAHHPHQNHPQQVRLMHGKDLEDK